MSILHLWPCLSILVCCVYLSSGEGVCNHEQLPGRTISRTVSENTDGLAFEFLNATVVDSVDECADACCENELCDVAALNSGADSDEPNCYEFQCRPVEMCQWTQKNADHFPTMVVRRSPSGPQPTPTPKTTPAPTPKTTTIEASPEIKTPPEPSTTTVTKLSTKGPQKPPIVTSLVPTASAAVAPAAADEEPTPTPNQPTPEEPTPTPAETPLVDPDGGIEVSSDTTPMEQPTPTPIIAGKKTTTSSLINTPMTQNTTSTTNNIQTLVTPADKQKSSTTTAAGYNASSTPHPTPSPPTPTPTIEEPSEAMPTIEEPLVPTLNRSNDIPTTISVPSPPPSPPTTLPENNTMPSSKPNNTPKATTTQPVLINSEATTKDMVKTTEAEEVIESTTESSTMSSTTILKILTTKLAEEGDVLENTTGHSTTTAFNIDESVLTIVDNITDALTALTNSTLDEIDILNGNFTSDIQQEEREKYSNTALLVTVLTFGIIFVLIVILVIGKRFYESYQRREYSKIDYLINGMYN